MVFIAQQLPNGNVKSQSKSRIIEIVRGMFNQKKKKKRNLRAQGIIYINILCALPVFVCAHHIVRYVVIWWKLRAPQKNKVKKKKQN